MARADCIRCGAMLQGRAFPAGRWGTWCPRCHAWWPDNDDGSRADDGQPPRFELRDDSPTAIVPVEPD